VNGLQIANARATKGDNLPKAFLKQICLHQKVRT
jgi:hypothetical protein